MSQGNLTQTTQLAGADGEMPRRLRETDWSPTPLGPMESWPASLRIALSICMNSRFPMFIWWGPQHINLYNDAYIPMLGKRHPTAFGRPAREAWDDIWHVVGPQADLVMHHGQATWNERVLLVMERHGYAEQTWFTWSYSPIMDESGNPVGLFCAVVEDTPRVLAERERDRLAGELQLSLDAAHMGWWRFNPADRTATLDARAAQIYSAEAGVSPIEAVARRIHPDDLPVVTRAYDMALDPADPKPFAAEFRLQTPEGGTRWIETHGVADFRTPIEVAGPQGLRTIYPIVGAVADITARRGQQDVLRTSEERLALAVDGAELGTFYCPMPLGRIVWNAKCNEHFWLPPNAEVDFDLFYSRLHPDDREPTRTAIEAAVFGHGAYDVMYRTVAPDGRQRWLRAKGRAYYDRDGRPTRFDGITIDVSAQKQQETDLREREARFRDLADAMPQIVWASRADGLPEYFNRRWYEYTRLPQVPLQNHEYLADVIHPECAPQVAQAWATALENRTPFECEYRLRRHDGVYRWQLGRAQPILDADGNVQRWYGTATDIDDQKQVEQLLIEREQRFRLATRATADAIWDWTLATGQIEWNEAIGTLFGYPPELVPPRIEWWLAHIHPDDRTRVDRSIHAVIDDPTQEFWQDEYRFDRGDGKGGSSGQYVEVLDRGYVLRDGNGRGIRMIGGMQDLSVRKSIERDRERLLQAERAARTEAERVSTMKDEFLATLSHELRTPLNAILGWSQLLKRPGRATDETAQGLEVIERNARAQSKIIEDLLDMSRIISGKIQIDLDRVDLPAVVAASIETARPAAEAKGVRLQSVIDPLHGFVVSGDASRLQQVLWNLISNAIKFTPRGGRVQVLLERNDGHVELSVADSGEGIAPEFLPHIFDRFRQADSSTTRRHGGLGLGLSIVKQLVELHGGTVRADSQGAGQGTVMTVSLPVRPMDATDGYLANGSTDADALAAEAARIDLRGIQVLVVDDEADARSLVRRLLEERQATVVEAATADEAFAHINDGEGFDAVVSDIGMPGSDGYSLMRRIRALELERGREISAIALTAYARPEDRQKAIAAGFLMHAAKPIEPAELLMLVAGAVGRSRVNGR